MKDCNEQVAGFERSKVRMSEDGRADIFGKAKNNRVRLKSGLAKNSEPKPIGMRTQGSYSMRTMIQHAEGDYDVDDGVYFDREALKGDRGADKSALDARKMVCAAVQDDRFTTKPEVRANCVRVYYNEGYHVDVPVYREIKTKNLLTGAEEKTWELASADWKGSDPLAVTSWFKEQNSSRSTDATKNGNDGQFVRAVRLMKAFARSRDGKGKIANGFTISKLVADHFFEDKGRDDRALRNTMRAIKDYLSYSDNGVEHPVLRENIVDAGDPKTKFLKERLEENFKNLDALDDPQCTHKSAMAAWDKTFSTDWFSAQPDPSDKDDLDKKTSGPAVIKRGESRFA